jgi:hypothetical protein
MLLATVSHAINVPVNLLHPHPYPMAPTWMAAVVDVLCGRMFCNHLPTGVRAMVLDTLGHTLNTIDLATNGCAPWPTHLALYGAAAE